MKSAGNTLSKSSVCSNGQCCCANGIAPESNQTSITSFSLVIISPHSGHLIWTSSTYGLWSSIFSSISSIANSFNSFLEPTESVWLHLSHFQIFNGVPQYLFLEIAQSLIFSSQFPNLPSPTWSGYQFTPLLFSTNLSFSLLTSMYHDGFE